MPGPTPVEKLRNRILAELNRGRGDDHLASHSLTFTLEPPCGRAHPDVAPRSWLAGWFSNASAPRSDPEPREESRSLQRWGFLRIRPAKNLPFLPAPAQQVLASLPGSFPVSFELVGAGGRISVQMALPKDDLDAVVAQVLTHYPKSSAIPGEDALKPWSDRPFHARLYRLRESPVFQLKRGWGKIDPLVPLLTALSLAKDQDEMAVCQILFQKTSLPWRDHFLRVSSNPWDARSPFIDVPLPRLAVAKTQSCPLFATSLRLGASSQELLDRLESCLAQYDDQNGLVRVPSPYPSESVLARSVLAAGMILSLEEIAGGFVHLPSTETTLPGLVTAGRSAPPPDIATLESFVILGTNSHRGMDTPVGISEDWASRGVVMIAKTGMGKSTLLKRFLGVLDRGFGLALLDPAGDTAAEDFLALIPSHRVDDVVYFDPAGDSGWSPAFNVLASTDERNVDLLCSDILVAFQRFYSAFWGPQTEMILRNAILTLLLAPEEKYLSDVPRLLLDKTFRDRILEGLDDPTVKAFWTLQFPKLAKNACNPVLNKLSSFIDNRVLSPVVSQPNRIDIHRIVGSKKIFIANLAKGVVGEDNAFLLGSFLLSRFQTAMLSRAAIPKKDRSFFPILVDEFHNYADTRANAKTLNSFFSESRKNNMPLVAVTQYLDQVDDGIRAAIFGNVGTIIAGQVGSRDGALLQREFGGFDQEDFANLGVGETLVRMGRAETAFNMTVLNTPIPNENRKNDIIRASRERFCRPRREVELLMRQRAEERQGATANPSVSETFMPSSPPIDAPVVTKPSPTGAAEGSRVTAQKATPARRRKPREADPQPLGRGGQEHKYLQHLIKRVGEERGFAVTLEKSTLDGHGSVDVALERDTIRIACEISVTSTAEYEAGNITKCISAGYEPVLVVCAQKRSLQKLQVRLAGLLTEETLAKVRFYAPEDVITYLDDLPPPAEATNTIGGYKVKVRYTALDPKEKTARKQAIADVLAGAAKRFKRGS